jgi:hypothetical protein
MICVNVSMTLELLLLLVVDFTLPKENAIFPFFLQSSFLLLLLLCSSSCNQRRYKKKRGEEERGEKNNSWVDGGALERVNCMDCTKGGCIKNKA